MNSTPEDYDYSEDKRCLYCGERIKDSSRSNYCCKDHANEDLK